MTTDEDKRKHLQLIQDAITRMGGNSFLLKGWSITLITATIGLSITNDSETESAFLIVVATALVGIFWALDAYYLSRERAYIKMYDAVRGKNATEINYDLDPNKFLGGRASWPVALGSNVFLVFYAPVFFGLFVYITHLYGIIIYLK